MREKVKRPFYKKWWFIVIVVIIVLSAIGAGADSDDPADTQTPANQAEDVQNTGTDEPIEDGPDMTLGEKNALAKANDYLSFMAFSHSGLIEQLEFEGYTTEEATFAADNCGADWKEQAAKKAQDYLDTMSFSREGLIDQLKYEGFTQKQAEYGVAAVGY